MEIKRNKSLESTLKMSTHTNKNWIFLEGKQANKKPIIVRRKQGNQNVFARNRKPFFTTKRLLARSQSSTFHVSLALVFGRPFFVLPGKSVLKTFLSTCVLHLSSSHACASSIVSSDLSRSQSYVFVPDLVVACPLHISSSHSPQFVLLVASL